MPLNKPPASDESEGEPNEESSESVESEHSEMDNGDSGSGGNGVDEDQREVDEAWKRAFQELSEERSGSRAPEITDPDQAVGDAEPDTEDNSDSEEIQDLDQHKPEIDSATEKGSSGTRSSTETGDDKGQSEADTSQQDLHGVKRPAGFNESKAAKLPKLPTDEKTKQG